jgi:cold shock CspA family protein
MKKSAVAYASLRQGEDGSKSIFVRYEEVSCCLRQSPTGGGQIQVYICQVRRGQLLCMPASDRGRTDPSLYLSGMKRSAVAYASLRQAEDGSKSIFVRYEEVSCCARQPLARGRADPSLYLSGMKRSPVAYASLRQAEDGSKSIFVRYEEVSCYLRQPPTGGGRVQVYICQV